MATDERTAAMDALIADSADLYDAPAAYEGLSEAMYSLSAQLAMTGWLDDDTNHAMYERVVKQWQALPEPALPPASADALGEVERVMAAMQTADGSCYARGIYRDSRRYWENVATAAMSAMSPANERVAELEAKVHEQAMEYLALDGQAVELMAKVAAMKAAGDRLAVFAGHSDGCDLIASPWTDPGPECDCGYTKAWQAWSTANGD